MHYRVAALLGVRALPLAAAILVLSACTTAAPAPGAWAQGQQATVEGEVASIDTTPWTYDGSAVIVVSSPGSGDVRVQLPARWNLCKAQPPDDVNALKPGDRVTVTGTATAKDELVVCAEAAHQLRKIE